MDKGKEIKAFRYVKEFNCIGPDCVDNCCSAGWQIAVDNNTKNLYEKNAQELLDTITSQNSNMMLKKNGTCICFNKESLCDIQKNYGEEYLSDTCAIYPRKREMLADQNIISASLSCPEIVKLVLFGSNPFDILDYQNKRLSNQILNDRNKTNFFESKQNYYNKIRAKIYNFINNSTLRAEEMLTIFISISYSLHYINDADWAEAMDFYLESYSNRPLVPFQKDNESVFKIIFIILFETSKLDKRLKNIINKVEKAFNISVKNISKKVEISYGSASKKKLEEILKIWQTNNDQNLEEIQRRIVKYYLLSLNFSDKSPIETIAIITSKFVLMKAMILACFSYNGNKIDDEEIITIVQATSRVIDHKLTRHTFIKNIEDLEFNKEHKLLSVLQAISDVDISSITKVKDKVLVNT